MNRRFWGLACVTASVTLAACGSEPKEPVSGYFSAMQDGDYEKACDQFTKDGQVAVSAESESAAFGDCAATLKELDQIQDQGDFKAEVEEVQEDGNSAEVSISSGSDNDAVPANPITVVKTDDGWKVDDMTFVR